MLTALIKCYLEIQQHFSTHIHKDDKLGIAEIYSVILNRPAPEYIFIREIETVSINSAEIKKKLKNLNVFHLLTVNLRKRTQI